MIRYTSIKRAALVLGAAALTVTGTLGLAVAPAMAENPHYDGYCYAKKTKKDQEGAAIGAAAGAAAGALFGKKGKKGKSAVIGAAVGGVAGYVIGKNENKKVKCDAGKYYVFSKGYYDPRPAQEGYDLVFFEERPADVDLYVRYKGQDKRYTPH